MSGWVMGKTGEHEWTIGEGAAPGEFVDAIGGERPIGINFGEGRSLTLYLNERMRFVAVLKNAERPEDGTRWAPECGDVDKVFGELGPICNEPEGHDGDHVATDRAQTRGGRYSGGTEMSRW